MSLRFTYFFPVGFDGSSFHLSFHFIFQPLGCQLHCLAQWLPGPC
jgi:hypothetical protein